MKHYAIASLLLLAACGGDQLGGTSSGLDNNGVGPTAGHAPNAAPVWDTATGACDNADYRRIEGNGITVCAWNCVTYQGTPGVSLEVAIVEDSPGVWHTAQEQSSFIVDPSCAG